MCEIAVESFTLVLLVAGAPAGAPQAHSDVGRAAVAVVWRYIRA